MTIGNNICVKNRIGESIGHEGEKAGGAFLEARIVILPLVTP